uniref:Uncharacterized protein n=1 Tax=Tanacetum cinerariifolium TaxID=118510 RepID=A0A6L2LR52_TANCI|nr:hypothetical protein [Tanacetum cinerariifolium]
MFTLNQTHPLAVAGDDEVGGGEGDVSGGDDDELMCMSYTDVAQVTNAARNYEILHERDDQDSERPDKRSRQDREVLSSTYGPVFSYESRYALSSTYPMGIEGITKVSMSWFLGCDLGLDCREGGKDNAQCRDIVH